MWILSLSVYEGRVCATAWVEVRTPCRNWPFHKVLVMELMSSDLVASPHRLDSLASPRLTVSLKYSKPCIFEEFKSCFLVRCGCMAYNPSLWEAGRSWVRIQLRPHFRHSHLAGEGFLFWTGGILFIGRFLWHGCLTSFHFLQLKLVFKAWSGL